MDGGADDDTNWPKTVSSAKYVENVNEDPIIIVNGLTKNWRLPGFRICWIVGPKRICDMLSSAGSFLDGGANAPLQKLALPLMDMDFVRRDAWALQRHFRTKRDFLLRELSALGITVQWQPTATFYIWANLSALPSPLSEFHSQHRGELIARLGPERIFLPSRIRRMLSSSTLIVCTQMTV